jgi:hypothetical protein
VIHDPETEARRTLIAMRAALASAACGVVGGGVLGAAAGWQADLAVLTAIGGAVLGYVFATTAAMFVINVFVFD